MGHFRPPGSGSGFRIRIRNRIHWPDWIRIQSGSETLEEYVWQVDLVAAAYLLRPFSSPFFRMKWLFDYGFRGQNIIGWQRRIPHLLMHFFLDEGFKHRLHSPQLSAVQLTQLGLPQTRPRLQCKRAVFRIHDILGWIRIRILGSMLLTGGSGSGFWIQMLLFCHWPSRCQQINNL